MALLAYRQVVCIVADMEVLLSVIGVCLYEEKLVDKRRQVDGLQHKQLDRLNLC